MKLAFSACFFLGASSLAIPHARHDPVNRTKNVNHPGLKAEACKSLIDKPKFEFRTTLYRG
jgi:hypothetical protein